MIVDDEELLLFTTAKLLEKNGFKVIQATSAIEAIGLLKRHPVEVMILDGKMPGMDGLEALKTVKQFYPFIQVIILTGHATSEAAIEGLNLGAFDYIMKPISIEELIKKIENAYYIHQQMKEKKEFFFR